MSTSTIFIIRQVAQKQAVSHIYFFIPLQEIIHHSKYLTVPLTVEQNKIYNHTVDPPGAFHLVKISGISGSAVNGTHFVGSSHWKIPRQSGKCKKVGPFSRLEQDFVFH